MTKINTYKDNNKIDRLSRLNELLISSGIECALLTKSVDITYFTGFTGDAGYLIIDAKNNAATLYTDSRFMEQASYEIYENISLVEHGYPITSYLINELKNLKFDKLGIETSHMTAEMYIDFDKSFNDIVKIDGYINDLRSIKDNNEIRSIKKAQAITDNAFGHILKFIKPGITEIDVAAELEYFMKKAGAKGTSFPTIAVSGKAGSLPHGQPSGNILKEGMFLTMDFGCIFSGYCSDMTRTVAIGDISDKMTEVYSIVLKAQTNAIKNIKSGMKLKDADNLGRSIIDEAGYGSLFGHGLGHGVGLEIHEAPYLSPRSEGILKPGMVVTIEPGIYLKQQFGVRIEDMLVIGENENEDITMSPKALINI